MPSILKSRLIWFLGTSYAGLLVWWIWLNVTDRTAEVLHYTMFNLSYAFLLALVGGVAGIIYFRRWGGWGSAMGRGILFISLGLLGQWLGTVIWSYYALFAGIEIPYPSLADIGYFSLIPFNILAIINFARVVGARFSFKKISDIVIAVGIPFVFLIFSYRIFLADYEFDFNAPLTIFLDFAYPLGEVFMISLALLIFLLSRNYLGGIMKNRIRLVIFALFGQYLSDFIFLYQASRGILENSGTTDLVYTTSFFITSLGLVVLGRYEGIRLVAKDETPSVARVWNERDMVVTAIVREQAAVIGPIAWYEAKQVEGLAVDTQKREVYLLQDKPRELLENLSMRFENLFGKASLEVSRSAIRPILPQVTREEIPEKLQ